MSQNLQILNHIKQNGGITPKEALELYGCMRLAARVYELRGRGHSIESVPVETNSGAVVSKYVLKKRQTVRF